MGKKDIVVIGSGLTGLTCAHYLARQEKDFIVIDKQTSEGGVIGTKSENGFTYEMGPNTGVIANAEVADLFEELKDQIDLEIADEASEKRYILKNGKLVALPAGLVGGVTTPLFTFSDKLRLLGEPFRKKGTDPHESLADLVRRRMGQSFLDYAVDPFILGIYAGDPERLVPKYALPKLYNLEQKYGSFIGGAIKKGKEKNPEAKKATRKIFSVSGGLHQLTRALKESAGTQNFILGVGNVTVSSNGEKYLVKGTKDDGSDLLIHANKVISTVDASSVKEIFPFIDDEHIQNIEKLHYTKVIEVAIGFNEWNGHPLDAFGALIPHKEKRDILGIMFMSSIFKGRAPEGGALITLFMGGVRRQDLIELDEEAVFEVAGRELSDILGLKKFKPDLFRIMRHDRAIPQYRADSKERMESIEKVQAAFPGLVLGGNIRDGIGMADRIKQGKLVTMKI